MHDATLQTHTPPEGSFPSAEDAAPKPRNRHQRRRFAAAIEDDQPQGNRLARRRAAAVARNPNKAASGGGGGGGEGPPLLCRTKETCRLLSVGMTTLYEMMNSGELRSTIIGGRRLVYYQSILEVAGLADQDAE